MFILIWICESGYTPEMKCFKTAENLRAEIEHLELEPGDYAIIKGRALKSFAKQIDLDRIR